MPEDDNIKPLQNDAGCTRYAKNVNLTGTNDNHDHGWTQRATVDNLNLLCPKGFSIEYVNDVTFFKSRVTLIPLPTLNFSSFILH